MLNTWHSKLFIAIGLIFCLSASFAQELTKKRKVRGKTIEEFFVLKENKDIRQGEALTTTTDFFNNVYINEYGQYDNNLKSGRWVDFYFNPTNFLKSMGDYSAGKKNGTWRYYYPAATKPSLQAMTGRDKRTSIIPAPKDYKGFQIQYDTTGQQIMCTGIHENDNKAGVWRYYSRSGYLFQEYNHDSKVLITNRLVDPKNDLMTFLGGPERFHTLFYMLKEELEAPTPISKTSEVVFEVDPSGNYKFVRASGDTKYKTLVLKIFESMPTEWILIKQGSTEKLQIVSRVVVTPDSFMKFKHSLDFEVIKS